MKVGDLVRWCDDTDLCGIVTEADEINGEVRVMFFNSWHKVCNAGQEWCFVYDLEVVA